MKTIPLTQGKFAIVDDADYDWLKKWKWRAMRDRHTFYAARSTYLGKGKQAIQSMHRLILGLQSGDKMETDHLDGNGLNNQQTNLRVCTTSQNQQSSRKRSGGTSRYKGTSWNPRAGKWHSQICVNRKVVHLGFFDSEIESACSYDRAAVKYHGQYALTNKTLRLLT